MLTVAKANEVIEKDEITKIIETTKLFERMLEGQDIEDDDAFDTSKNNKTIVREVLISIIESAKSGGLPDEMGFEVYGETIRALSQQPEEKLRVLIDTIKGSVFNHPEDEEELLAEIHIRINEDPTELLNRLVDIRILQPTIFENLKHELVGRNLIIWFKPNGLRLHDILHVVTHHMIESTDAAIEGALIRNQNQD
ncbi:hypothetical protein [Reichenbachiella sp.]|uniref:hypothetical protein n=1 Tax=Reichenbachiella sp. TaxID=2184521 RepID=UPI003BB1E912